MALRRRVLVGGTFACDKTLATPLALLLRDAVYGVADVHIEWLGYGSATDLTSLHEPLPRQSSAPIARVELVVLLVRLSDLQAAHPELITRAHDTVLTTPDIETSIASSFLQQLLEYDQRADSPPLLIQFCPSPPSPTRQRTHHHKDQEDALYNQIQSKLQRVKCCPSSDLLRWFAREPSNADWYNAIQDKREHAPYTQRLLNVIALSCTRHIARCVAPRVPKKVVVLDCDNTLWGGAVADVGAQGIVLSERFLALQRFALSLQQRGLLLCLCSKNIPQDVESVFRERAADLVLQLDTHIVTSEINWRPKSQNIQHIATRLALHLDAFVFIDDNAIECHEVATALPMVTVIHVPDDFDTHFLESQWVFDTPLIDRSVSRGHTPMQTQLQTEEDTARTLLYQQNAQRAQLQQQASSQAAFLSSLGIRIQFERVTSVDNKAFARVLQLHQRTNTFNVATSFSRALTSAQLELYLSSGYVLTSTVTDRYGHYGLVCVALFRVDDSRQTLVVDSFLMSCRALNRGAEHAMLRQIAGVAHEARAEWIEIAWEPTVRNEPVRMFLATVDCTTFVPAAGAASGGSVESISVRHEKLRTSAGTTGVWRMETSDARVVTFLKDDVEDDQPARAREEIVPWQRRVQLRASRLWVGFVRFLSQFRSVAWIFRLLSWLFQHQTRLPNDPQTRAGLLKTGLHNCELLDAFIAAHFTPETNAIASHTEAGDDDDNSSNNISESDESFRLRARHRTKLVLLDHVADDAPRVVWAPQREHDVRLTIDDGDGAGPVDIETEHLQQFHRPCTTPSCATPVYWESSCAFQRCRTCCYRVQRLLARATDTSVHAKARAYAVSSLQKDFNVTIDGTEAREEWCATHKNERRRK